MWYPGHRKNQAVCVSFAHSHVVVFRQKNSRAYALSLAHTTTVHLYFFLLPLASRPRLFELFDLNGSGSLNIQELIAGLSALCIGTTVDKARIVFDQYDTNGVCAIALYAKYGCPLLLYPHPPATPRVFLAFM